MRKRPPGKLLPTAHAVVLGRAAQTDCVKVHREYRVLQSLHKRGFPVPKPHFFCADTNVIGQAFYVMEFVEVNIIRLVTYVSSPLSRAVCFGTPL